MVWSAISVHGSNRLHIVLGTMNGVKYISMRNSRLLPQVRDWFEQNLAFFSKTLHLATLQKLFMPGSKQTRLKFRNGLEIGQI